MFEMFSVGKRKSSPLLPTLRCFRGEVPQPSSIEIEG